MPPSDEGGVFLGAGRAHFPFLCSFLMRYASTSNRSAHAAGSRERRTKRSNRLSFVPFVSIFFPPSIPPLVRTRYMTPARHYRDHPSRIPSNTHIITYEHMFCQLLFPAKHKRCPLSRTDRSAKQKRRCPQEAHSVRKCAPLFIFHIKIDTFYLKVS